MNLLYTKLCKRCNQSKQRNNYHDGHYEVYPTKKWGTFCPDCTLEVSLISKLKEERNRLFRLADNPGESENKICKCCDQLLVRTYFGKNAHNSGIYKSDDGRLWHGRVCPDCYNKLEQAKRLKTIKPPRPVFHMNCEYCSKEFETLYKKQVCCSVSCKTQKSRSKKNSCKPKRL